MYTTVAAVVLLMFLTEASTQTTYHIRPTSESPRPHENLTLSEFASEASRYFNSSDNLTLMFLPGEHALNTSIVFQHLGSLTLLGDRSSFPNITSKIVCSQASALALASISKVKIKALDLISCGSQDNSARLKYTVLQIPFTEAAVRDVVFELEIRVKKVVPAISSLFVPHFHFDSCQVKDSYLPLLVNKTTLFLSDSEFVGNTGSIGGGVAAYNSTVDFLGQNLIHENTAVVGGGVYAERSVLVFEGLVSFVDNFARYGGGIYAIHSTMIYGKPTNTSLNTLDLDVICNDSIIFLQNRARFDGGGMLLVNTTMLQIRGILNFTENHAGNYGGGVVSGSSRITLNGLALFLRNSALKSGGAVAAMSTIWDSAVTSFTGNLARSRYDGGGAVYSEYSEFTFGSHVHAKSLHTTLQHMSATCFPGGEVFCKGHTTFLNNSASSELAGGGGIYALESQFHFKQHIVFTGNYAGNIGGGMFGTVNSGFAFSGEIGFFSNGAQGGAGVGLDLNSTLIITGNGTYADNIATDIGGLISAYYSFIQLDGKHKITKNSADNDGGAISLEYSGLKISGETVFGENSASDSGGALYVRTSELELGGMNTYARNAARYGGGILSYGSNVTFTEVHNFTHNLASYGGGLVVQCDIPGCIDFLYITPNSSVFFLGNHAQNFGGAIFIQDTFTFQGCRTLERNCFIKLDPIADHAYESHQYTHCIGFLMFEGNSAEEGGNIIYGGALQSCKVELGPEFHKCTNQKWHQYNMSGLEAIAALTRMPAEQLTRDPLNIISDTYRVCTCETQEPNCKRRPLRYTAYPGETTSIALVAVGENFEVLPGPATVQAEIIDSKGVWLGRLEDSQTTISCTSLGYTLLSNVTTLATLSLTTEGQCGNEGVPLYVFVDLLPCPVGFALAQSGSCGCERRLQQYTDSCDINSRAFAHSGDLWLGFDHHSNGLILHPHCPFDYCKLETVSFTLNTTDLQCAHGRSGTLCGACKSGQSLNLGSSQCTSCSNVFLLLFLVFVIAGFLLVLFLFICKVTVAAGTISGLIFYANVLAVNKSVFFPSGDTNILTVFIAWMNLDLGIETCFIDGLDAYTRTWLQFVFPLYIWLLVGIITLVSHYSTFIARIIGPTNPIAVLATLFLLSYTKLLRTIIATFSFTTLDYPNDESVTVWVYDGNIRFLEGKHIPLFLAGLLAFLLLFLPYTLLLLFGQCVEAGSNHKLLSWASNPKVRSFLDAYHAPYKNRYRYWTGLLLLIRFVLFITSAVIDINSPRSPSVNFLVLGVTCAGLMLWAWNIGSMYRKRYNNALESSAIFNLAILALASYQVQVEGGNQAAVIYTSVGIAFITFLAVITYHLVERVREWRIWRHSIRPRLHHLKGKCSHQPQQQQDSTEMAALPPTPQPPQVTKTVVDLREPLDLLEP